MLRVIRSPYPRAGFTFGDLDAYSKSHAGITRVFTASDIPGENCFGVIPKFRDQPVFAEEEARFRGEAVAAVVGQAEAVANLDLKDFPVTWSELEAVLSPAQARLHEQSTTSRPVQSNLLLIRTGISTSWK